MSNKCVREKLLSVIDDMEVISKELFETVLTPKSQRITQSGMDHSQLADLLVAKDKELKKTLKCASEQEELQKKINTIQGEVDKQDEEIIKLQRHLKEAEHILATAIYEAKQKLALISKANDHPIVSEELIKYSHRISSSYSVAAPYNWEQGDTRRPYPTDVQMRCGILAQFNDPNIANSLMQQQQQQQQSAYGAQNNASQPSELTRPSSTASTSSSSSFHAWQNDIKPNISSLSSLPQPPGMSDVKPNKDNDDVEVMSTDSSSSSSSDSQ